MKTMRLLLIVVALGAVIAIFIWNYQRSQNPEHLIKQAEAGSETALAELETLNAAGDLTSHSDAIGLAATRIAQSTPNRFDEEHTLLIRWQQLFLDSNPIVNASQATRLEFAKANIRFELIGPSSIDSGQEHHIGVADAVALRDATLDSARKLEISFSYDNYFVNEQNIFEGAGQLSGADIHPPGLTATGFIQHSKVLVTAEDALAPGTPISLRCEVKVRLEDHAVTPPAIFAEWTEELAKTSRITGG